MFSGIKSILFGTTDHTSNDPISDVNQATLNNSNTNILDLDATSNNSNNNSQFNDRDQLGPVSDGCQRATSAAKPSQYILTAIKERTGLVGGDTSALIEQTLNAAASRFAEQLLPQSPSIDELQSNSRHLLPTLNEQRDDLNKSYASVQEDIVDKVASEFDDGEEDDTWELLDLVEKSASDELTYLSNLSGQGTTSQLLTDSSASNKQELELEACKAGDLVDQDEAQPEKSRNKRAAGQKLKVSFELPDLVRVEPEVNESADEFETTYDGIQLKELEQVVLVPTPLNPQELAPKKLNIATCISENEDETESVLEDEEYEEEEKENLPQQGSDPIDITTTTTAKQNAPSNFGSGNDSHSDLTEMDESWYVTPPPCFTGSNYNNLNKFKSPKATKEAARENALIEHPSIYISSKSKQQQKQDPLSGYLNEKSVAITSGSSQKDCCKGNNDEMLIRSMQEDELDDIDDQDAEDDDIAEVSEIDAEEDDVESDMGADINLVSVKIYREDEGPVEYAANAREITDLNENICVEPPIQIDEAVCDRSFVTKGRAVDSRNTVECSVEATEKDFEYRPPSRASTSADTSSAKKAPLQVRPIEPERQPGWQLRRKRSRRRPLSAISVHNPCNAQRKRSTTKASPSFEVQSSRPSEDALSSASSSMITSVNRDSPAFINRIGSSIVANINNLTSGLPMRTRLAMEEAEKLSNTVMRKTSELNPTMTQKRLTKAYLDRQNSCARMASSNRRADRRLKMHSTPNGYSIDRKVHTNFH